MKKILIIGGNGLIGKKLISNIKKKYKLITPKRSKKFNIAKYHTLNKYINNKIDVIINLSGQVDNKKKMHETIITGNKNIIKLSKKINKKILIIYLSTNLIYGYSNKILNERSKTFPKGLYAKYKLRAEKYYENSNLNYLILRIGNVYGDIKNEKNIISKIYNSITREKKLLITNSYVSRNFISLEDTIKIIKKILIKKLKNNKYNVGNENLNLKNIIKYFEKIYKKKVKFIDQSIKLDTLSSQKVNSSKILFELNLTLKNNMYKYLKKYKKK